MRLALLILIATLFVKAAAATPVQWPLSEGGNGHFYEFVDMHGVLWTQARDSAAAMTWSGTSGHLATLTSQAENDWVCNTLNPGPAWLGGYQAADAPSPSVGWHWVTGEPWAYTNWYPGEPNDGGTGNEWALHFELGRPSCSWNDLDGGDVEQALHNNVTGFVVEYENFPVPVENTTWGRIKSLYR